MGGTSVCLHVSCLHSIIYYDVRCVRYDVVVHLCKPAGSEISFFKNGVCQGVAFTDLFGGRYYPAASMYTLPNQPNCEVRFNFGPDFEYFPQDFGGRQIPRPMSEVPYHGFDGKVEGPAENGFSEKTS
ncbi:hypothetical protein B296_00002957 [Ensete ventricosum]|uniref:SPRY domain-containing protein n=1 Tax=Ensete ventricosum TaxID=4639 RepID=A0A427AHQ3_ENSVE|nr:hypothetical protein B296_00002957 [Ensete ventricosum]